MKRLAWGIGTALINGAAIFIFDLWMKDDGVDKVAPHQLVRCLLVATLVFLVVPFLFAPLQRMSQAIILGIGSWLIIPYVTTLVAVLSDAAWEKGIATILFMSLWLSVVFTSIWLISHFIEFWVLVGVAASSLYGFSVLLFGRSYASFRSINS